MGARRSNGHNLSSVLALVFFFTAVLGSELAGINRNSEEHSLMTTKKVDRWEGEDSVGRRLSEPGSLPPTCRSRCGRCFPCRPVHVAIWPGRSVLLEYYPEAWRCKCASKLFMP